MSKHTSGEVAALRAEVAELRAELSAVRAAQAAHICPAPVVYPWYGVCTCGMTAICPLHPKWQLPQITYTTTASVPTVWEAPTGGAAGGAAGGCPVYTVLTTSPATVN